MTPATSRRAQAQAVREQRDREQFMARQAERNAGRDDSNRCPSAHYFGRNCCQLERGHDGPHVAEFVFWDGEIWGGLYRIWEHDISTVCCNQRDVSAEEYKAYLAAHPEIPTVKAPHV